MRGSAALRRLGLSGRPHGKDQSAVEATAPFQRLLHDDLQFHRFERVRRTVVGFDWNFRDGAAAATKSSTRYASPGSTMSSDRRRQRGATIVCLAGSRDGQQAGAKV